MSTPTFYGRYPSSSWKAPVANAAALPLFNNIKGDARVTLDSDDIYIWDGSGWLPVASPAAVTAITALLNTSDVTANGPGAVPATVNSVGGSSAANIHTAELAANSATNANTPNTIVKRNGSGNFSAGTITASLTGVASGNVVSVSASSPLFSSGGVNPNITIQQSNTSQDGYLSSTDWNTFNNKQPALTFGNLTDVGTDGIVITGGTGAVIGSGTSIAQAAATASQNGYLTSTDWSTFNNKAPINSPAFTGIPTAPTAGVGTSTTQIATTAFVLSQGFTGATGSMPFAHQSSTSVVTSATTTYVTAITTTITTTASSAPVYAKATATLTTTTAASVAKYRVSINAVAGQEQLVSLTATATDYTAAVQYISASLGPGTYTILFEIARNSGTGTVNFIEGTLDAIALQGTSSNGITQLTGDVTAGPGSGSQASTIANLAVTNAKIANTTIDLTTKVTGILPLANGGTNANLTATNGAVIYSTATAFGKTAAGSANQILQSAGAASPTWSTATYPATTTINQILYSNATNTVTGLATTNTGALVTSSTGVPSLASGSTANRLLRTNGTTVSFAQAALATDVSGTLPAANGGTGHGNWANQQIPFGNGTSLVGDPNFIYDTTNNRFIVGGSGTFRINAIVASGGTGALQAYSEGTNNCFQIRNNAAYSTITYTANDTPALGSLVGFGRSRGTQSSRTQSKNGDTVLNFTGSGYTGSADTGDTGGFNNSIVFVQTEDATATANGGEMIFNTTPNTTRTPIERLRIKQSGESVFANAIATARYTTAQKNALTPVGGWVVFDTDLNQLSYYNGTVWVNL